MVSLLDFKLVVLFEIASTDTKKNITMYNSHEHIEVIHHYYFIVLSEYEKDTMH